MEYLPQGRQHQRGYGLLGGEETSGINQINGNNNMTKEEFYKKVMTDIEKLSAEWHYEEENDAHYIVDMLIDLRSKIDNMINALKED